MNWSRERFCTFSDLDLSWRSTSLLFLLLISFPLVTCGQVSVDHHQHSHPAHPSHSCAEGRRGNLPLESQPGGGRGQPTLVTNGACDALRPACKSCHQDEGIHADVCMAGLRAIFSPFPHRTESYFINIHRHTNPRNDVPGPLGKVYLNEAKGALIWDEGCEFLQFWMEDEHFSLVEMEMGTQRQQWGCAKGSGLCCAAADPSPLSASFHWSGL